MNSGLSYLIKTVIFPICGKKDFDIFSNLSMIVILPLTLLYRRILFVLGQFKSLEARALLMTRAKSIADQRGKPCTLIADLADS